MKWSFSSLKQFKNCPRQYYEVKIKKSYAIVVSPQMQYGTEVHKALEDYARDRSELPKFYRQFKPQVDALLAIPGEQYLEFKMALDENQKPCDFDAPDYWVRGIVDFMVIDGDTAYVIDYKTGSNKYPDVKQLKLMSLMIFQIFNNVNSVKAGLLFVVHNSFLPEEYKRRDIPKLWSSFTGDLARMKISFDNDMWPENPTGLCGYCPVKSCQFNRRR
jgi:RecB family exonuclease